MFGKVFWYLEIATLVASIVAEADACHRCGRSQCVYAAPAYVAPGRRDADGQHLRYQFELSGPARFRRNLGRRLDRRLSIASPPVVRSANLPLIEHRATKAVNGTMSLAFQQGNALRNVR